MKSLILILLFSPLCAISQTVGVSVGNTFSSLDWSYIYFDGTTEPFFTGSIASNISANFEVEYLKKDVYSLTSYLGFFQSGGEIAEDEFHQNFIITESRNRANNLSLGTNINVIPVNKKLQLMLSFGPRLDYLMPHENSAMDFNSEELRKVHFGLSAGLGIFYNIDNVRLGIRGMYLHRFADYIDVEPFYSNNWAEPSKLGVRAKDRFLVNTQFVIGYNFSQK